MFKFQVLVAVGLFGLTGIVVSSVGHTSGRDQVASRTGSLDIPRARRRSRGDRLPMVVGGRPRIIDADTIAIAGERIRLEGIDAPERGQMCLTANGANHAAGRAAIQALAKLIAGGPLTCRGTKRDRYGRLLGTCFAGDTNLNRELVVRGHAWAFLKYSRSYVAEEAIARRARVGVWRHTCQTAWTYRKRNWVSAQTQAPDSCPIKGNISRGGRIYHVPWSRHYARTRIDPSRGERWFCSEDEAIAAGWRAAG